MQFSEAFLEKHIVNTSHTLDRRFSYIIKSLLDLTKQEVDENVAVMFCEGKSAEQFSNPFHLLIINSIPKRTFVL